MSNLTEQLVFDRTQADIDNDTWKGQYNPSDLNRVESWCKYLAEKITEAGYPLTITTKTTWTNTDMREATEMERIRQNIKTIMQGYYYITQIAPTAEAFDWQKANNWEQILFEIYALFFGMRSVYVYSGVARSGQPRIWQNRWRRLDQYTASFIVLNLASIDYPRYGGVVKTKDYIVHAGGHNSASIMATYSEWFDTNGIKTSGTNLATPRILPRSRKLCKQCILCRADAPQ